jgi:hypothetical protein
MTVTTTGIQEAQGQSARFPKLSDLVERAGWTAGQQFLAVLLTTSAASSVVSLPWKLALATSAGAAIVSVLTTFVLYLTKQTGHGFWGDLGFRLGKTFLASLLASMGAGAFNVLSFHWGSALDLALVATLSALGKGLLARGPDRESANPSTLPAAAYQKVLQLSAH